MQLEAHDPTVKRMQEHYAKSGKEVNEARLRMATLPKGAEVCAHYHCDTLLHFAECQHYAHANIPALYNGCTVLNTVYGNTGFVAAIIHL